MDDPRHDPDQDRAPRYPPEFLAERWNVSIHTIYRLARSGELAAHKVGRQFRFSWADIRAYEKR